MKLLSGLAMVAALLLSACRASEQSGNQFTFVEAAAAPILTSPDAVDSATYAKPLEARVTHVALDLTVDFNTKRIGGTATLDIDRRPDAKRIILDDSGLEVAGVVDAAHQPLPFRIGP